MNTLKGKFSEIIICTEIEGCSKQSDDCVKIAEDFAVNFAEWYFAKCYLSNMDMHKTTKELLEIYKNNKHTQKQ